jgi:hypothetical protein
VVGGFIGRSLSSPELAPTPVPRFALPTALVVLVAVLVYATPITSGPHVRATATLSDAQPPPKREVNVTVKLDPPNAAKDAYWFVETAWQGKEGRSVVSKMREVSDGVYRTTQPLPVYGNWKTTLRLHKGFAVSGLPVYFPADPAIPVKATPAPKQFTRDFARDKKNLQREQKAGVPGFLTVGAYFTVLVIFLFLYTSMGWGLARLQRGLGAKPRQLAA